MDSELQEMRDLIAQLRMDNERLQQERAAVELPNPGAPSVSTACPSTPRSTDVNAGTVESFKF